MPGGGKIVPLVSMPISTPLACSAAISASSIWSSGSPPAQPRSGFPIARALPIAPLESYRLIANQIDQHPAPEFVRHAPGLGLVDEHQRGVNAQCPIHSQTQCRLNRSDRIVAAIGIAGEIGLAHAADKI